MGSAQSTLRQSKEVTAGQTLLSLRYAKRDPLNWHCGTGPCKKAWANYNWCKSEQCGIIGFHEEEPKLIKGGNSAWKQAHSFIKAVQINDPLFLHSSRAGFVMDRGIFTGEILTNDPYVNEKVVLSAIPDGVRVTFDKNLNDGRPDGWSEEHSVANGKGDLIFYKIFVHQWIPLLKPCKGAGFRGTLYQNEKTADYPDH